MDTGGSSACLSGEEYRRWLFGALNLEPWLRADVQSLPYGSGSGLENPAVHGNGYVFCVKIGNSPRPWFRYVPVDGNWDVLHTEDGETVVSADTLISLRVADPQRATAERRLPDDVYESAFNAWKVAQESVFSAWKALTDPNAFQAGSASVVSGYLHASDCERRLPRKGRPDRTCQPSAEGAVA